MLDRYRSFTRFNEWKAEQKTHFVYEADVLNESASFGRQEPVYESVEADIEIPFEEIYEIAMRDVALDDRMWSREFRKEAYALFDSVLSDWIDDPANYREQLYA